GASSTSNQPPGRYVAGSQEQPMDTSGVERFFALRSGLCMQQMDDMDLDMLAPYISMDDDFQLTCLEPTLSVDAEQLPDKRHKGPLSVEDLLVSGCLEESNQSERDWNQLLTDKDPVLGGVQNERTVLMADFFLSRPPDLSSPLSPMT
uniref:Hypoxia-inducible factor alpha subunit-like domain-containing protein n=1 Tax=Periophthalmus magnuspinnatus TaxID=409849 RepID=A0A3B4B5S0_9GOBI